MWRCLTCRAIVRCIEITYKTSKSPWPWPPLCPALLSKHIQGPQGWTDIQPVYTCPQLSFSSFEPLPFTTGRCLCCANLAGQRPCFCPRLGVLCTQPRATTTLPGIPVAMFSPPITGTCLWPQGPQRVGARAVGWSFLFYWRERMFQRVLLGTWYKKVD